MRELLRLIVIIAVAAIIGVNLANTFRPLLVLWSGPSDFVSKSEERLLRVPENLPASGEIGYMSETLPGDATIDPDAVRKYYLMQYALAPRVVVLTPTPRLPVTVGDFDWPRLTVAPHSGSIQDMGHGVVIIQQKEK